MRLVLLFLLYAIAALSAGCRREQPGAPKDSQPNEEYVIIFRAADGRTLTMAELNGLTGTFQYEIVGKSNVPAEADSLHKLARHAGGRATTRRRSPFWSGRRASLQSGPTPFMTWRSPIS